MFLRLGTTLPSFLPSFLPSLREIAVGDSAPVFPASLKKVGTQRKAPSRLFLFKPDSDGAFLSVPKNTPVRTAKSLWRFPQKFCGNQHPDRKEGPYIFPLIRQKTFLKKTKKGVMACDVTNRGPAIGLIWVSRFFKFVYCFL